MSDVRVLLQRKDAEIERLKLALEKRPSQAMKCSSCRRPCLYCGTIYPESPVEPQRVLDAVSEYFGVSVPLLSAPNREVRVAEPRHYAMYLLRTDSGLLLKTIGQLLSRDHSTVIAGVRKVLELELSQNGKGVEAREHLAAIRKGYQ